MGEERTGADILDERHACGSRFFFRRSDFLKLRGVAVDSSSVRGVFSGAVLGHIDVGLGVACGSRFTDADFSHDKCNVGPVRQRGFDSDRNLVAHRDS